MGLLRATDVLAGNVPTVLNYKKPVKAPDNCGELGDALEAFPILPPRVRRRPSATQVAEVA